MSLRGCHRGVQLENGLSGGQSGRLPSLSPQDTATRSMGIHARGMFLCLFYDAFILFMICYCFGTAKWVEKGPGGI